ncbi:MAG: hypothetical protein CO128_03960 [Ignavibacteriales bacterium CG_4_9_14_3_um_filter_30_11]|nr:MAG: hypothetical protein CO128_03960 [Ignavibacteriales bacterium CG_4_9_14_3_um_filter_30_11]
MKTKNLFKLILLPFLIFPTSFNFAQDNLEVFNKVSSDWKTDFTKHSVDFSEFMGGGPQRDGIPAIDNPQFESIKDAKDWLNFESPVISIEINGTAKAYPLAILIWHEIINDKIGVTPISITFCPLCYSTSVFKRIVDGKETTFGTSGLLRNSNLVMYDRLTESLWQEFIGEAIIGKMTGTKLTLIPSQIISFEQFEKNYPDGTVLSRETGFTRYYGQNPYIGYDNINSKPFLYRGKIDKRLPPNEKILAIEFDGNYKAYPYSITEKMKIINDDFVGNPVLILHLIGAGSALETKDISKSRNVGTTGAFSRIVDGKILIFKYDNLKVIDEQTKSVWSITGKAIEGKLKGTQLKKLLHGDYFSFAWFAFRPETILYQ